MIDLPPADSGPMAGANIWLPSKPAIFRPAEHALLRPGAFRPCSRAERQAMIADLVATRRLTPNEAKRALFFVPVVGWGLNGFEASFVDSAFTSTDGSNTTFSSLNLGEPRSDRYILVVWTGGITNSGFGVSVNTITVAGVSATYLYDGDNIGSSNNVEFWIAAVPTGISDNVVVVLSKSVRAQSVHLYRLAGLVSTTPTDTGFTTVDSSSTYYVSIDCDAGGVIIGGCSTSSSPSGFNWSGITERSEEAADAGRYSSAFDEFASGQTGLTVSCTFSGTAPADDQQLMAAISMA